ncbi:MAG: serine/threonine-protein kinase, partial [Planctomycetota bacterium]
MQVDQEPRHKDAGVDGASNDDATPDRTSDGVAPGAVPPPNRLNPLSPPASSQPIRSQPERPNIGETEIETDLVEVRSPVEPIAPKSDAGGDGGGGVERSLIEAARLQAQHRSAPAMRGASPGGSIPGYRILREIHRGGQGVVYLAVQEGTRRKVAVKVMRQGPFTSAQDRVRFEREVQVLAQINNPNIVGILDSGVFAGSYFYVMDYISGHTLDDYVRLNELSHADILRLFITVCDAVNAAHLRGVIHRDLKPGNIRVTPRGEPQVLDFGLAKLGDDVDGGVAHTAVTHMTETGQFIGSLPWASPEQARGESEKIDVRTDVYALGVMLYQLVCGQFPYRIEGPMAEVVESISKAEPSRPRLLDRRVGGEL